MSETIAASATMPIRLAHPAPASRLTRAARAVFRRQPLATIVVVLVLVCGLFAPVLAPYNPALPRMPDRLQGPSDTYLLGTEEFGRDLLRRLIFGAGIAVQAGVIAVREIV